MSKSLDGVLTKKANTKETFTEDQIQHLSKCIDPKDGYMHFAKHFAYIRQANPARVNSRHRKLDEA